MNPRAKNHPSVSTKTLNVQAGNMAFAGPKKILNSVIVTVKINEGSYINFLKRHTGRSPSMIR